ncbi:YncE family protein [Tepidibacter formicigenes]|jgi:DNA-binding beta-propeller fold protein YncE|uniref:Uncharacterized protein n=1 Tax=Tepidibacter formicigenes DSM 15518 TaxID=1123349 RepID=A0A1M6LKD7_9FIRM|nr:hypothetical protein [Tepidibacter formicigenes]SHJ71643.1 hypothetical protein SAMN02744037_00667 [Tepidibacter formicigenes DSM 15518]
MKRKILGLSVITILFISVVFLVKNYNRQILAYIPNVKDGTISVIDVLKKEQVDIINVGESASHGIATTIDGKKIYTGDLDNGRVLKRKNIWIS